MTNTLFNKAKQSQMDPIYSVPYWLRSNFDITRPWSIQKHKGVYYRVQGRTAEGGKRTLNLPANKLESQIIIDHYLLGKVMLARHSTTDWKKMLDYLGLRWSRRNFKIYKKKSTSKNKLKRRLKAVSDKLGYVIHAIEDKLILDTDFVSVAALLHDRKVAKEGALNI
jgi:hypothetical protein